MITYGFALVLFYFVSSFFLKGTRFALNLLATITGMLLLLNDWNNTIVPDATMKLVLTLTILLYGLCVFVDIHGSKGD